MSSFAQFMANTAAAKQLQTANPSLYNQADQAGQQANYQVNGKSGQWDNNAAAAAFNNAIQAGTPQVNTGPSASNLAIDKALGINWNAQSYRNPNQTAHPQQAHAPAAQQAPAAKQPTFAAAMQGRQSAAGPMATQAQAASPAQAQGISGMAAQSAQQLASQAPQPAQPGAQSSGFANAFLANAPQVKDLGL